jgi:hypothetical protein
MTLLLTSLLLAGSARAWDLYIYSDTNCDSNVNYHAADVNNVGYIAAPPNNAALKIQNMDICILWLLDSMDTCEDNGNFLEAFDAGEENECLSPDYSWGAYQVADCTA